MYLYIYILSTTSWPNGWTELANFFLREPIWEPRALQAKKFDFLKIIFFKMSIFLNFTSKDCLLLLIHFFKNYLQLLLNRPLMSMTFGSLLSFIMNLIRSLIGIGSPVLYEIVR